MKKLFLLLCQFLPLLLFSQSQKGAAPLTPPKSEIANPKSIRALVVGISDYQDNNIPDLYFAHRDAQAFADWLKSPAGGSVPEDNILLLTNEKATFGALGINLDALVEDSKPDDHVIIYFSGHGDVETKMAFQLGYLLCWNSPAQNYMAGAFPLFYLQNVVATLSANNVNVTLVTDACHAGKLAGSDIGGAQLTGQNLARQFAKESKILSCQSNEFSIEGEQWGDGRGVFSYFLVKGLTGLADKNNDGTVSLFEIQAYLQNAVPAETEQSQMPFTMGNLQAAVAQVDVPSLDRLRKEEEALTASMKKISPKGLEDEVLAKADSTTRQQYHAFKNTLATGNLLEPTDQNAWDLFQKLARNDQAAPLHKLMRRNLATALLDEVQQALNALLDADPYAYNKWYYEPSRFGKYPEYLQRAMDLLGENHYMRRSLMSKKLYFEALNLKKSITDANISTEIRDSLGADIKSKLLSAIQYEDKAAYLYHAIGTLYLWNSLTDTVILYNSKAIEYSPHWLLPYLDISLEYQVSLSDFFKSEEWLNKVLKINPESYVVLERLSWLRQWQNRTDESLEISRKMIAMKPDLFNAYGTAAVTSLMRKEFAQAENYFLEMEALSKSYNNDYFQFWINLLIRMRRMEETTELIDKIMQDDSTQLLFKSSAAVFATIGFQNAEQVQLAEKYASSILQMNVSTYHQAVASCQTGWGKFQEGKIPEARQWMEKATEILPDDPQFKTWNARLDAHLAVLEDKAWKADSLFRQAIFYPPNFPAHDIRISLLWDAVRLEFGQFLLHQKRYAEARQQFQTLLDTEPLGYHGYYGMALLATAEGRKNEALDFLERSCELYFPSAEPILEEPLFKKIRKTKRFKTLMEKHFPG